MSTAVHTIHACEVCGNPVLQPALDLGLHPMCDDLVAIGDARQCAQYPISILFCDQCLTAHQQYQIPKQELFPQTYHYRSRNTADVLSGMRALVASCTEVIGSLQGKRVLDVGCNDGSLLGFFRDAGATTFGIEPTGACADAAAGGHTVFNDFLDERVAALFVARHGQPDVITFTNVFAHIEDLKAVLRSLRILCAPTTVLVIENHYLGAVLEKHQFDTFYHEHPRTYSYRSFVSIAEALGMFIAKAEFPSRYGGNIRVFMQQAASAGAHDRQAEMADREKSFGRDLQGMKAAIATWKVRKLAEIEAEVALYGRLSAKAFPGRAAILIKLLGLDDTHIAAVHEKPGSGKIGHYVPGTRIPIRSDDDFVAGPGPLLNLAWHISAEIRAYMASQGYQGRIIDILSQDDFQAPRA
jgi:2-polyprenyl-3-methyl-5-hydroxy-6-metoxy-1,4-benzoquinol methylase